MKNLKRCLLCAVFACMIACGAVRAQVTWSMTQEYDSRRHQNNFYWYNPNVVRNAGLKTEYLDTLNYCRVKQNRIKSVTIYRLSSWTDSVLVGKQEYDTTGMTSNHLYGYSYATRWLTCDSVAVHPYPPREKLKQRNEECKEVWLTDALGYVKEYRYYSRDFTEQTMALFYGTRDYLIEYRYDASYRTVVATRFEKRIGSVFNRWRETGNRHVYTVDAMGNVIHEFQYGWNGSEEYVMKSGYTYYYEYY